jgi:hypothetical protein
VTSATAGAPKPVATAEPAARPRTVTAAASLTAFAALAMAVYGVVLVIGGLAGKPVLAARAETAGAIFVFFGLGVLWVARGLAKVQPWARTPAMLMHFFIVVFSYPLWLQDAKYLEGVPLALYGLAGLTLLFVPASHAVLSRTPR